MLWLEALLEVVLFVAEVAPLPAERTPLVRALEEARWKQRVVLVLAPTPSSRQPAYQEQRRLLTAATADLRERDVLVLYRPHGELFPADEAYLRQHYRLSLRGFEVVLIGKDGTVKLYRTQPVAPAELFGLIDQMPMRQQEMRR